jgi:hypothetical protein
LGVAGLDDLPIGQAAWLDELVDNGINPVLIFLVGGRPGKKDQLGFVFLGIVLFAHGFFDPFRFKPWVFQPDD